MAGYSGTPLVKKLGIRPNEKIAALPPPTNYEQLLAELPAGATLTNRVSPRAKFVHLFVTRRTELEKRLAILRGQLDDAGTLWISWPKKAAKQVSLPAGLR